MPKTTCRDCNRTVVMVQLGENLVATEPELITVVTAREKPPSPSMSLPRIEMATRQTFARRLHAELCAEHKERGRRDRLAAEQREYNRTNGTPARPPRRNHGL